MVPAAAARSSRATTTIRRSACALVARLRAHFFLWYELRPPFLSAVLNFPRMLTSSFSTRLVCARAAKRWGASAVVDAPRKTLPHARRAWVRPRYVARTRTSISFEVELRMSLMKF